MLDRTFTFTHTYFKRLTGDRLVREDPNPDLTAPLDATSHGTTRCLNLTRSYAHEWSPSIRIHRSSHYWRGEQDRCYGLSLPCGIWCVLVAALECPFT